MQFFDEKFWIAISFLIFLYLVYKPIKNIILKSLDDQITLVKKQVLEAQKLNDEMARLYEDIVHQLDQFGKLKESLNIFKTAGVLQEKEIDDISKAFINGKGTHNIINYNRYPCFNVG